MEPEHYLNKIKDIFIAMPIRVLAERVRALQGKVTQIENLLTHPGSRGLLAIFYQSILDLSLGTFIPQRLRLAFRNVSIIDNGPGDYTEIEPYFNTIAVNGVDQVQFAKVGFQGSIVDVFIDPDGVNVTFSDYSPGLLVAGPTTLDMGAVADGEFLKRVGGTIVGAVGVGGATPTGTGFRHVTIGFEDPATKLVDTADINNDQVTFAKMVNIPSPSLIGRGNIGAGDPENITLGTTLTIFGTVLDVVPTPVLIASYAPGSIVINSNQYALMVKRLQLTGVQRLAIAGTGRMRIT